jgi:hypothetical protein
MEWSLYERDDETNNGIFCPQASNAALASTHLKEIFGQGSNQRFVTIFSSLEEVIDLFRSDDKQHPTVP